MIATRCSRFSTPTFGRNKNHRLLAFFAISGSEKVARIEGLASSADLANEYLQLLASE